MFFKCYIYNFILVQTFIKQQIIINHFVIRVKCLCIEISFHLFFFYKTNIYIFSENMLRKIFLLYITMSK